MLQHVSRRIVRRAQLPERGADAAVLGRISKLGFYRFVHFLSCIFRESGKCLHLQYRDRLMCSPVGDPHRVKTAIAARKDVQIRSLGKLVFFHTGSDGREQVGRRVLVFGFGKRDTTKGMFGFKIALRLEVGDRRLHIAGLATGAQAKHKNGGKVMHENLPSKVGVCFNTTTTARPRHARNAVSLRLSTLTRFMPAAAIAIHHVDDALLVVEKPAGLLSVPGRLPEHQDCLISRVQQQYPDALVVHRLDQVTSGLMVLARGKAAHRALSIQFERREVSKRYQALVEGVLEADAGEIDLPLICDWPNRPRQKVDFALGKPSLTRWQVLARDGQQQQTRLALEPVTGRSHQLRVHLMSIGHPIVGDDFYGAAPAARVCLHAVALSFQHPERAMPMLFESAAPF